MQFFRRNKTPPTIQVNTASKPQIQEFRSPGSIGQRRKLSGGQT